ncbi:MAG TPA: GDSL-type esterase/lipase family protein [Candidatus Brocadiia bacterium]|nr:GDSL-type esterase/lipase family protein [Candidatus Brocadiia bacterium]
MPLRALITAALLSVPALAGECHVVLFGDSTVITSYLPKDKRSNVFLQEMLAKAYPGQKVRVSNAGRDGDYIGQFLLGARYQREVLARFDQINIAIVRYGQNDWKRMSPEIFELWQEQLYNTLEADYPGVIIIPEAGMYFDPAHFGSDSNPRNNTYWDKTRAVAKRRGYGLCDVFEAMKRETAAGNWDLRIRGDGKTFDASKDAGRENDMNWFGNGHPNVAGAKVAAQTQFETIRKLFADKLPTDGGRRKGDGKASVHDKWVIQPAITVVAEEKGDLAVDKAAGRLAWKMNYAKGPRVTFRVSLQVQAPDKARINFRVVAPTGRDYPLLLAPAAGGWIDATLYCEVYAPDMTGLEVNGTGVTAGRGLRVERLDWAGNGLAAPATK